MKLTQKNLLFIFLISTMFSCVESKEKDQGDPLLNTDLDLIRVNNQYSIEIPTFMNESDDLNIEASLQYQNIFKETYVIVIDEPKDDFKSIFEELGQYDNTVSVVKNYKDIQLEFFDDEVTINSVEDIESSVINGLPFEIIEVDATVDDINIGYTIAYVEGAKSVYMIMVWTLQDRHEKYSQLFKKVVKSFNISTRSKGAKKNAS